MNKIAALLLLSVLPAFASEDFPATAVVVSQHFIHTTAPSNRWETEIRVGPIIYRADNVCQKTTVGKPYPAHVNGNKIVLQVGEKTCHYRIVGQRIKD